MCDVPYFWKTGFDKTMKLVIVNFVGKFGNTRS